MPYLHERKIYLNRRHTDNQFYTIIHEKESNENYIVCIAWDLSKIYIYSETGKLCERIMYGNQQMEWGRAIELSEDARFTLFRPSEFKADLYLVHLSLKGFE